MPSKQLSDLVAPISEEAYNAALHEVVDPFPSRFLPNPGNIKSAEAIKARFAKLGFDVRDQRFNALQAARVKIPKGADPGETRGNIIAYMKGTDLAHELVVFGAHYDSVNWQDTSGPAPGVDDNGSGMAAVFLAAQALAAQKAKTPPRRSVAFVAFQAEEEGLLGSTHFVQEALAKGDYGKPVAALIADEVAYSGRPQYARKAIFETVDKKPANMAIIDTLAHTAKAEKGIAGFEVNYHGFGSDHIPFLDAGYPAVLLIERDNEYHADEWGHSAKDTFQHVDPTFGAAMTRLATNVVLTLASPKA